ncbi:hypothetical protein AAFF_G00359960 [Aldrovandia affinis]|uniref:Uncharacterized protein n=1 Tax=Aldrovandia affinis TaxID=143900 RepID=A0AAD7WNE1_9TELE|nr:hypothetical protein AAFF_G00359960 [Aldrovandia affinis]
MRCPSELPNRRRAPRFRESRHDVRQHALARSEDIPAFRSPRVQTEPGAEARSHLLFSPALVPARSARSETEEASVQTDGKRMTQRLGDPHPTARRHAASPKDQRNTARSNEVGVSAGPHGARRGALPLAPAAAGWTGHAGRDTGPAHLQTCERFPDSPVTQPCQGHGDWDTYAHGLIWNRAEVRVPTKALLLSRFAGPCGEMCFVVSRAKVLRAQR